VDLVNIMTVDSVVTSAPLFVELRDAVQELARTECVLRIRMVALLLVVLEPPATRYLIVPAREDTTWNAHKVVVSTRKIFHNLIGHFGYFGVMVVSDFRNFWLFLVFLSFFHLC